MAEGRRGGLADWSRTVATRLAREKEEHGVTNTAAAAAETVACDGGVTARRRRPSFGS